jgi:hypothetical protein
VRDFLTSADRPQGPRSLNCNGYQVDCPWVQWPGRGIDHPPPSGTGFKERDSTALTPLLSLSASMASQRQNCTPLTSNIFVITCNCTCKNTEQCPVQIFTRSTDQRMSRRLWYRTFHYQVRRSPPLEPVVNHTQQTHTIRFTSSPSLQFFGKKL